jgi:hypothetical protein
MVLDVFEGLVKILDFLTTFRTFFLQSKSEILPIIFFCIIYNYFEIQASVQFLFCLTPHNLPFCFNREVKILKKGQTSACFLQVKSRPHTLNTMPKLSFEARWWVETACDCYLLLLLFMFIVLYFFPWIMNKELAILSLL